MQYDHPNHTVTVTTISDLDLTGGGLLGLPANQVKESRMSNQVKESRMSNQVKESRISFSFLLNITHSR